LTINNHDIDVGMSFKYLGTVVINTNDKTKEIKARIQAAIKPVVLCKVY
jgi:hypothetical protein